MNWKPENDPISSNAPALARSRGADRRIPSRTSGAGVDARELEEVVDELREDAYLLAERGYVLLGPRQPVLERLQHGLHGSERRALRHGRFGLELRGA